MLIADVPALPAYALICTIDPATATGNGQPIQPDDVKATSFTLTMAQGAQPISIQPQNLVSDSNSNITHLRDSKPTRTKDNRVVYQIGYQQPLFPPSENDVAQALSQLGTMFIDGILEVDPRRMTFNVSNTITVKINMKLQQKNTEPLQLKASGFCVERAISPN